MHQCYVSVPFWSVKCKIKFKKFDWFCWAGKEPDGMCKCLQLRTGSQPAAVHGWGQIYITVTATFFFFCYPFGAKHFLVCFCLGFGATEPDHTQRFAWLLELQIQTKLVSRKGLFYRWSSFIAIYLKLVIHGGVSNPSLEVVLGAAIFGTAILRVKANGVPSATFDK